MGLRVFDTLSGEKRDFTPLEPGKVRMYVCGITSYAPSHIGHGRAFVAFDVIFRWLKKSYAVTFVRNFTDIDDKIINAAKVAGEDPKALSERCIALFYQDIKALGCVQPDVEPRVTEHIAEIIDLVGVLENKGFAYRVEGDVYFEVERFAAYGRLSGLKKEELEDGARVEIDPRKRAPRDFALWKAAKPGEPFWPSPFGPGRPGWHIECSAMGMKYLGQRFDIHGGGKDLVFPHHENEIAQSCAATGQAELASFWLHNGFVNLMPQECPGCKKELSVAVAIGQACSCGYNFSEADFKMSKSRGNFYPINEVIAEFEPAALRLLFLSSHYRSPIQFSHARLEETERRLDRMLVTIEQVDQFLRSAPPPEGRGFVESFGFDPLDRFRQAMDDDFNTAIAIAELGELLKIANDLLHAKEAERLKKKLSPKEKAQILLEIRTFAAEMGAVLGLFLEPAADYLLRRRKKRVQKLAISEREIEGLIRERTAARSDKNFVASDAIRDRLKGLGVELMDTKAGTSWTVAEDF